MNSRKNAEGALSFLIAKLLNVTFDPVAHALPLNDKHRDKLLRSNESIESICHTYSSCENQ